MLGSTIILRVIRLDITLQPVIEVSIIAFLYVVITVLIPMAIKPVWIFASITVIVAIVPLTAVVTTSA